MSPKRFLRLVVPIAGALAALALLVAPHGARAQVAAAADSAAHAAVAAPDTVPHKTEQQYIQEIRDDYTPENRRYWTTNRILDLVGTIYGVLVACVFLFGRWSVRIRDFANARTRSRYLRTLIYVVIYSAIGFVLAFPLTWYQGFALQHEYHLSKQSFGGWFLDQVKEFGLDVALLGVVPLVMLAYMAIAKYRRWWLALAIGTIPVSICVVLLGPLVFEPAFNKFQPLRDQQLKQQILALAAKAGIPARKVVEVDKSKQTETYNAYVSGFGASQHLVLWDTTLKGMKTDEILFVMGHEMGHYRLGHIWKGLIMSSVLGFVVFFLVGVFMNRAVRRFGPRWGFTELSDIASLPLFEIALGVVFLVVTPVINTYSRSVEHQADQFGLELTHSNDAAARTFIKLGAQNKSNPEPPRWLEIYSYSHPALIDRVKYAMEYRPWEEGKPNQAYHPEGK